MGNDFSRSIGSFDSTRTRLVTGTQQEPRLPYVLLRRVVELVLPGAAETLLDAGVGPQAHHGGEQLGRVRLRVLHAAHHVTDHLGVGLREKTRRRSETVEEPDGSDGAVHGGVRLVCPH